MATRPIIEVAVNDAAFQKFIEQFNSYNEMLGEQPSAWAALNDAIGGGKESMALVAAQAGLIAEHIRDANKAQSELNRSVNVSHNNLKSFGKTASSLSRTVSGAAKASISEIGVGIAGIAETAAAALGPVGIAAAAIAAVVGAAGAAGKALADAAVTRQRSAFSKGITPGQEASFGVYAQQFMGAGALQAAANNQLSFGNAGQLAVLGIDFNKARTMSASDLAYAKLRGALSAAQASPNIPLENLPAVQAYLALGGDVGDVRNALKMGPGALNASQAETSRNAARLDLNRTAVGRAAVFKKGVEATGILAQSAGINTVFGTVPDAIRNPAAALASVGTALQHVGQTIVQHVDPALHALQNAVQGVTHALTTPIVGSASAAVIAAAKKAGVDPLLALADAQHESGLNPKSRVRDFYSDGSFAGYSTGLFQLNEHGEGAGMSIADMMNPSINATVAMRSFAKVAKAHPNWSPGQIAFAAEGAAAGPGGAWKKAYINDVNARYAKLVNQMRNTRPPTVSVKVSNSTQSRVSVSVNGAALASQH
jgi:hypothetical protein